MSLLSPLLPVEGSLDLPSDAAPQRPNTFIHIKNTNGHNQHGKILIWQPFFWVLIITIVTALAKDQAKMQPCYSTCGGFVEGEVDKCALTISAHCWKSDHNNFILWTGQSILCWGPLLSYTILLKEFYWEKKKSKNTIARVTKLDNCYITCCHFFFKSIQAVSCSFTYFKVEVDKV